jgi:hypothetical protein
MTSAKTENGRPCFNFKLKPIDAIPQEKEEDSSDDDEGTAV